MNVLVTGGAGYIGSHVVNVLKKEQGFTPIVYDNFSTGHPEAVSDDVQLVEGDIRDVQFLKHIMAQFEIDARKHRFAPEGLAQVFDFQRLLAHAAAHVKAKAHMVFFHGLVYPLDLVQPFLTAFGGADALFAVKAAVALDNGLLALDLLLLQMVGFHARLKIGGALFHVLGIVARKFIDPPGQHFAHRGAHMVQKIAVVADNQ